MKRIVILGSTGSIGTNTLDIISKFTEKFQAVGLTANGNVDKLEEEARKRGVRIFPVDSEHSALFQSMEGHRVEDIRRLILTASGGPLWNLTKEQLRDVTVEQALKHPNWKMGDKITIDSATLMNKGLEVVEARWLFDIPASKIEVVVHRESIIHSLVEYADRSVIAQLGLPDMRTPIAYAMNYPERVPLDLPSLNLAQIGTLTFFNPDHDRFPCLTLGYDALRIGGTMPAAMNAANEVAVQGLPGPPRGGPGS